MHLTVSRTISTAALTITESVTAPLPDNLVLDDDSHAETVALMADALFFALPSLQPRDGEPPREKFSNSKS